MSVQKTVHKQFIYKKIKLLYKRTTTNCVINSKEGSINKVKDTITNGSTLLAHQGTLLLIY